MWADRILNTLRVVKAYPNGTRWAVQCPVHDDGKASATFTAENGIGKINCLVCRGTMTRGDFWRRVLENTGTKAEQWFEDYGTGSAEPITGAKMSAATWECSYDYRRVDGSMWFQVIRQKLPDGSKKFVARRPRTKADPPDARNPDWVWQSPSFDENEYLLYRIHDILNASPEVPIMVVEGEKDVDLLAAVGFVATTNPFGAGNFDLHSARVLKGRKVVIFEDNDAAGRARTAAVAGACVYHKATAFRVVRFDDMAEHADVSDWVYREIKYQPTSGVFVHPGEAITSCKVKPEFVRSIVTERIKNRSELWQHVSQ